MVSLQVPTAIEEGRRTQGQNVLTRRQAEMKRDTRAVVFMILVL